MYRYEIYIEGWSRYDWFCEDAYFVAKGEKLSNGNFGMISSYDETAAVVLCRLC